MSRTCWRWLVAAATLLAVSCGGGATGDPSGPGETQVRTVPGFPEAKLQEATAIESFVASELGLHDGLLAILYAWERGYSHSQLLALGSDGFAIAADGRLSQSGAPVDPTGPPQGVINLPPAETGALRTVGADETAGGLVNCPLGWYSLNASGGYFKQAGFDLTGGPKDAITMILAAIDLGIEDEAIGAIITGAAIGLCTEIISQRLEIDRGDGDVIQFDCSYVIIDRTDVYPSEDNNTRCGTLAPSGDDLPPDDGGSCASPFLQPYRRAPALVCGGGGGEPDPTEVRVYRGRADITLTRPDYVHPPDFEGTRYPTRTCVTSGDAELVARPDGTLTFTFSWEEWVTTSLHPDDPGCIPVAQLFPSEPRVRDSVFDGTWDQTMYHAKIGDALHLNPVEFEGEFTQSFAITEDDNVAFYGVTVSGDYGGVTGHLQFALDFVEP